MKARTMLPILMVSLGSTTVVRLFCKQMVVGSTPTQGSDLSYQKSYELH